MDVYKPNDIVIHHSVEENCHGSVIHEHAVRKFSDGSRRVVETKSFAFPGLRAEAAMEQFNRGELAA